ncbi:MAG: 30S ribosomal protein S12 methylthiotransferase RimO, partial [Deltaproteobacteria bacterium]|nr:30S ribosomal protein S12 methylthiotransferase RimO [Deltaproteobacteria bacterium]
MSGKGKTGIAVRIQTLGCAKNSVDAEVMSGFLVEGGCRIVSRGSADVGIVNTCGFIRDAKEESIEEILALAREKERGRIRRLVVAGCLAKRYRDELPEALPEVDLFIGPGDIPALPRLVKKLFEGGHP